ncbi:NAD(P)-dependent dehydrogenase, short-chain alcohol dehydrogenase family [Catalinimonas alkaloidigena]|uniref:NAD(P)-dependent dehydrogenase, short-chain alcohol dehydrogenase family n=1 Tax=Catalinimonas alkaloidigena TaxID=1075417 RepID=A0A1G9QPN5_9BACT|nr:SDR family oxidoreductase [Catalinimonas alkaloidigena]SDM12820.1 NAD(P)-dependent dehydrogenase, short-chain alcohol dehydrogenase family [Catalinimonas alkaloidigena]
MAKDIPVQQQEKQPGLQHKMHPEPEVIRQGYKGADKLKGKVALITGGDSGIGRSVAVHFAREGADVAIVYHPREEEDAQETKKQVAAEGRECLIISGDLRESDFCQAVVKQTLEHYGKLNVLVNNAAVQYPQESLEDITDEQLEKTFETNIFAYFRVTRAALEHLREGDSIVNTTSVTAYRGSPGLLDYSSTKGAIVAFTRSLSSKLAEKNIRVNAVAPGPIWTPLIPSTFPEEKVDKFGENVPMKRPGQPSEVAPAYVFLACDDASYITGQVIHPNGGEIVNT